MIIKIFSDKQKAISVFEQAKKREEFNEKSKSVQYPTFTVENYYEIIKELCTAILLNDGIKTTGENAHVEMINLLSKYEFSEGEIAFLQDLRIRRNQSVYEGKQTKLIYLENNEYKIKEIISKLKQILKEKLK